MLGSACVVRFGGSVNVSIMRLLGIGLATVCALAATACSGQQRVPERTDPQTGDLDVTEQQRSDAGVDSDGYGGSVSPSSDSGGIQEISIDVIGFLFPATAADASNLFPLGRLFGAVNHAAISECMGQAGFEYPPYKPEQFVPRFFEFPDLDTIAEIGFGMTHDSELDPDPAKSPFEDLVPPELEEQFLESLRTCADMAENPMRQLLEAGNVLEEQWWSELFSIDSSPAIVEQFAAWRQCMADGGRPVSSHRGFFSELDGILLGLLDDGDQTEARTEELAAAALYVACMEPLEEVRQPLRDAARRQFLEDNFEEVRAIQELADRLIREAQEAHQ